MQHVITIDGPAAAGKGTLARALAAHLGYDHLDTGGLYRAVALLVRVYGANPEDAATCAIYATTLNLAHLQDPRLREEETGRIASIISAHEQVRAALLHYQRQFAAHPPSGIGAVLDGRDTGTVICPDAAIKFFITASPAARAKRRYAELLARGEVADLVQLEADIAQRDARDANRSIAPLRPAEDAYILDTSTLDAQAVLALALAHIASI